MEDLLTQIVYGSGSVYAVVELLNKALRRHFLNVHIAIPEYLYFILALGLGVFFSFAYDINFFETSARLSEPMQLIATGIALGVGASVAHDQVQK